MLSIQELKSSTKKELISELKKANEELVKVCMGIKTKHLKDTSMASKQRRYIARIHTALKELEVDELIEQAKTLN